MTETKQLISLAGIRNELIKINANLQDKCNASYSLNMMQYKHRDVDAVVYDETSNKYDLILCLYHENKCISSITGRYDKTENSMELLSKTDSKYEGLKYNLYLRTIFIYLMCFVRPKIKTIVSHATNPISTYTMYKHYHAINADLIEYVKDHGLQPDTFSVADARHFHDYVANKYKQTLESAEQELEDMLEDCSETFGTECGVTDLGWATKEEAIEFILSTMNVTTITLELNLDDVIEQELLHKIFEMNITCGSRGTKSASGGKRRKKSRRNKNKSRRNK
jgi:hypothetical protein